MAQIIRLWFRMQKRILVYLQHEHDAAAVPARFSQSIVQACNSDTIRQIHDETAAEVFIKLRDNRLYVSESDLWSRDNIVGQVTNKALLLKSAAFCPIRNLTDDLVSQLSVETQERGVDVGCAVVLESSDGSVLLIRRAAHLRTFPGIWVPPGGHIEENETLIEAGLRELKEETGLDIHADHCLDDTITNLALWESSFPPTLSLGLPVRHHIVLYLYAKLKPLYTASYLQNQLQPDPEEVGATMWVPRSLARAIVSVSEEYKTSVPPCSDVISDTINITAVDSSGVLTVESLLCDKLLHRAPSSGSDIERVSTGTKFALDQWLQNTERSLSATPDSIN